MLFRSDPPGGNGSTRRIGFSGYDGSLSAACVLAPNTVNKQAALMHNIVHLIHLLAYFIPLPATPLFARMLDHQTVQDFQRIFMPGVSLWAMGHSSQFLRG